MFTTCARARLAACATLAVTGLAPLSAHAAISVNGGNATPIASGSTGTDGVNGTVITGVTAITTGTYSGGSSTFTGKIGGVQQTVSGNTGTGTILLAALPAPEPSQVATLAVGILGLGALALKARKRQAL